MSQKFKKNQLYKFVGIDQMDNSVPSKDSIIKIESAKGKRVIYSIVEGNAPENSNCHFWKESEMADALELQS